MVELKASTLKNKNFDELSSYLTFILCCSSDRTFIIGYLSNVEDTNFIKVFYDDKRTEMKYVTQTMVTKQTGLETLTLYLGVSDSASGFDCKFVEIISNRKMIFLNYLGYGSSSFIFECQDQQEKLINFVLKISRQDSCEEK
ncbi:unnamed protein product [Rotaria sp. Silwood1]|nr:unnamed protein product [Rotaria sp. Silwood1]